MFKRLLSLTIIFIMLLPAGVFSAEEIQTEPEPTQQEPETLLASDIDFPYPREQYGTLSCERIGFSVAVFWDDTDEILDWGAGTSMAGYLPGLGKVIILSGHTLTHFRSLEYMTVGDILSFETTYGSYEYEITSIEVYNENDLLDLLIEKTGYTEEGTEEETAAEETLAEETLTEETSAEETSVEEETTVENETTPEDTSIEESSEEKPSAEEELTIEETTTEETTTEETTLEEPSAEETTPPEELIMYTCYPFYVISERKTNRYTVIAEYRSGPIIVTSADELQTDETQEAPQEKTEKEPTSDSEILDDVPDINV